MKREIAARISADAVTGARKMPLRKGTDRHAADEETCYVALTERDPDYEGVFYVGVRTTGVFCRPTCPARPPKRENCEFFANAQQALLASYRPCQRCRPLSHPNETSEVVRLLVAAVERAPDKRWREADFDALSVHASTARRQFKSASG